MERQITRPSSTHGFSLIELLVVVAIIAVLSVGVTLTVGRSDKVPTKDMALFQKLHERQRSLAITGQHIRALKVLPRGVYSARYQPDGWFLSDTLISWSGRALLSTRPSAQRIGPDDPQILFLPTGQVTAFSIAFSEGGRCETNGWGALKCQD